MRAWQWQLMLDQGVYATVSEIGSTENISKSYVSRILRLARWAPDLLSCERWLGAQLSKRCGSSDARACDLEQLRRRSDRR